MPLTVFAQTVRDDRMASQNMFYSAQHKQNPFLFKNSYIL